MKLPFEQLRERLKRSATDKNGGLNPKLVSEVMRFTSDMVVITDANDQVIFVNDSFTNVFGYSKEEVLGQEINEVLPEWDKAHGADRNTEGKSEDWQCEVVNVRRGDHELPIELRTSYVNNDHGATVAVVGLGRDLRKQRAREVELHEAKQTVEAVENEMQAVTEYLEKTTVWAKEMASQAELANVAKSEFLANMSHEIRTPLNAIIGMTELLAETKLNNSQQQYLSLVNSSSESLLSLINDILDFSKIEAGLLELENTEFNLQQLVEEAMAIFTVKTDTQRIELLSFVDPNIPTFFVGDPTRLKQILVNLVGNAIKFTEEGEVSIKVVSPGLREASREAGCKVKLDFEISDTGIGISNKNLHRIFDKFSQADNSTTRRFGGSGLGLNISKSLAELMGGSLWAESELGKGSTLHLCLELQSAGSQQELPKHESIDFKKLTILVVDDNPTNRFILRKTLESRGINVLEAASGEKALEVLQDQKAIDLIITDHDMPEMDGVQLVRRIRNEQKYDGIKIITLSSVGHLSQKLKDQLAVSETLSKPARQSTLFEYVLKALFLVKSEQKNNHHQSSEKTKRIPAQKRILIVEDNLDNQLVAKNFLMKTCKSIDIAENGQDGVEAAQSFQYDLILMDIQMPKMDGFQATKTIREWQNAQGQKRTPIIAVTAHALEGYREKCLEHGLDDYVSKPIRKNMLLGKVQKWLDPRPIVLVADDSVDNRKLIQSYVQKLNGYRFIYAQNGLEAVAAFKARSISLVLMDLEMPLMGGLDATQEIRKLPTEESIPILALTAHDGSQVVRACLKAGCTGHLGKPIRKQEFLETLQEYLGAPEDYNQPAQGIKS
jgi:PAS domain S-box-containing protein